MGRTFNSHFIKFVFRILRFQLRTPTLLVLAQLQLEWNSYLLFNSVWNTYLLFNSDIVNFLWETDERAGGALIGGW